MNRDIPPPPVELQCAIARGWSDAEIERRTGASVAAISSARVWLDELIAEDGPPKLPEIVRRPKRRLVAECGTRSGYMRHRNNSEPTCQPCRKAEREYQASAHQRRKGAA